MSRRLKEDRSGHHITPRWTFRKPRTERERAEIMV